MRYTYLGDALTAKHLVNLRCDPVRRLDGKCVVSMKMATAMVEDCDGNRYVVKRRRLRLNERLKHELNAGMNSRNYRR